MILSIALIGAGSAQAQPVVGYVEDFKTTDVGEWGGGTPVSNPGTGGVDGDNDGYLLLSNDFSGNFGTRNSGSAYVGDFAAAGITLIAFYLNDVDAPEAFSFHLLITGGFPESTWQHNTGFHPPNNQWQQYTVDLADASQWTRTSGSSTFEEAKASVTRLHFRHDLPPYSQFPDGISGTLGIDNLELAADCNHNGMLDRLEADTDQDGVIDACDACANTVLGAPVDASGCPETIPGDFDADGAVGTADFDFFTACVSGPAVMLADPECLSADLDADNDVDLNDFGIFQRCYRGSGQPADPACAN